MQEQAVSILIDEYADDYTADNEIKNRENWSGEYRKDSKQKFAQNDLREEQKECTRKSLPALTF
jgi:hypothetical protein